MLKEVRSLVWMINYRAVQGHADLILLRVGAEDKAQRQSACLECARPGLSSPAPKKREKVLGRSAVVHP